MSATAALSSLLRMTAMACEFPKITSSGGRSTAAMNKPWSELAVHPIVVSRRNTRTYWRFPKKPLPPTQTMQPFRSAVAPLHAASFRISLLEIGDAVVQDVRPALRRKTCVRVTWTARFHAYDARLCSHPKFRPDLDKRRKKGLDLDVSFCRRLRVRVDEHSFRTHISGISPPVLKNPPLVCPHKIYVDTQAVADLVSPLHPSPSVRCPHFVPRFSKQPSCQTPSAQNDRVAYPEARRVSLPSIASKKRKVSAGPP